MIRETVAVPVLRVSRVFLATHAQNTWLPSRGLKASPDPRVRMVRRDSKAQWANVDLRVNLDLWENR